MSLLPCLACIASSVHVYAVYCVACALIMMYNWSHVSAQLSFCDNAVSPPLALSYCWYVQCQHACLVIMLRNMVFLSVMLATPAAEEETEKTESAATRLCIGLHGAR